MQAATAPKSGMIPSLNGLRAVAMAIVFMGHAGVSGAGGGLGVTVFFFLSGYLITRLLLVEHDRSGGLDVARFYLRRLLRLTPPLVCSLGIMYTLVLLGWGPGKYDPWVLLSQLFYYHNYYIAYFGGQDDGAQGLTALWSLAVEEHFYLVYPFVFLAAMRFGLGLVVGLLAAAVALRAVYFLGFGLSEWVIYVSSETRMDSILWGCALALIEVRGIAARVFPARALYPWLAVGLGLLVVSLVYREANFRAIGRYSLQGFALMPLFYYAVHQSRHILFRWLNFRPIMRFGEYSYTVYIVHGFALAILVFHGVDPGNTPVYAGLGLILSVGYAAVLYHTVEVPVRAWRARLHPRGAAR